MGDLRKRKISDEVELLGFQITFERADMGLSCTNELEWIYDRSPAAMTQAVITYLAAWGGKQFSAQARVIKGLGAFWIKFPDADMERLAGALRRSDTSVQKLYDAGRLENDKLPFIKSVTDGVRYVLTGIYNQGLRGGRRLPMT